MKRRAICLNYWLLPRICENSALNNCIEEGKYISHEIVNELITLMGQKVLWEILAKIKSGISYWYS